MKQKFREVPEELLVEGVRDLCNQRNWVKKRGKELKKEIEFLKNECNVLEMCGKRRIDPENFSIVSFYGDSVLLNKCIFEILTKHKGKTCRAMNSIKRQTVSNFNLAVCYDIINLDEMILFTLYESDSYKIKGDIMEGILGEVHLRTKGFYPLNTPSFKSEKSNDEISKLMRKEKEKIEIFETFIKKDTLQKRLEMFMENFIELICNVGYVVYLIRTKDNSYFKKLLKKIQEGKVKKKVKHSKYIPFKYYSEEREVYVVNGDTYTADYVPKDIAVFRKMISELESPKPKKRKKDPFIEEPTGDGFDPDPSFYDYEEEEEIAAIPVPRNGKTGVQKKKRGEWGGKKKKKGRKKGRKRGGGKSKRKYPPKKGPTTTHYIPAPKKEVVKEEKKEEVVEERDIFEEIEENLRQRELEENSNVITYEYSEPDPSKFLYDHKFDENEQNFDFM